MKILHVIPSISPRRGGPSQAVWNLMEAIRPFGVTVELLTTDDHGPDARFDVPYGKPFIQNGFTVHYFPYQTRFYTVSLPLLNWLWRHVTDYDLLHIHSLYSFPSIAAGFVARHKGVPYIFRTAGMLNRWGRDQRRPRLKRGSIHLIEGPLLRDAAGVHFTTPDEKEQAADLGLPLRDFILPLGFDMPPPRPAAASKRSEEPFLVKNDRTIILFLSRINPVKGVELLLQAFQELIRENDHLRLVIAGEGEGAYVQDLKNQAEQLGLQNAVSWVGFVDGERKSALWTGADIFVLPSYSENFGVVLVEAMAAGVPIVTTDGVALHDVVLKTSAGLVVPTNAVDPLVDALRQLVNDPYERQAMGARGRQAAVDYFSLDQVGRKLYETYSRILARPLEVDNELLAGS